MVKELDPPHSSDDDDDDMALDDESEEMGAALPVRHNLIGISLDEAIGYVGLPRTVSVLNDKPILAALGPYGPYLKYDNQYLSLNKSDGDVLTISPEDAEMLVTERIIHKTSKLGRGVLAELGEKDGSQVMVKSGKFGVYLNWKRVNAKLPADYAVNPESIPLEEAWLLIQDKSASDPSGGTKAKKMKTKSSDASPTRPKRPLTAYLHFCAAKRAEVVGEMSAANALGEVSKKLAALWAETSAEERKVYTELAAAGKAEHEKTLLRWNTENKELHGENDKGEEIDNKKLTPKAEVIKPKRPRSAYLFFCAAKRADVSETVKSLGDITKELARRWAATSDRTEYELLAVADKTRYEEEICRYDDRNGVKQASNGSTMPSFSKKSLPKSTKAPSAYMMFCRQYRPTLVDDKGDKLSFGEATKRLAAMWRECDEETKAWFQIIAVDETAGIVVV